MKHWYYDKDTGTELWPIHFTFEQKKQFLQEVVGILPLEVGEDYSKELRYRVDNVQHLLNELKEQGIHPKDVHLYVDHIDEGYVESDGVYGSVIRASYSSVATEQDVVNWVVMEFNNYFCDLKKEYEQAMEWVEDHGFVLVQKQE